MKGCKKNRKEHAEMKHEYVRSFIKVPKELIELSKDNEEELNKFINRTLATEMSKEILKQEHIIDKEVISDERTNTMEVHFGVTIVNTKDYKEMLEELEMYRWGRK